MQFLRTALWVAITVGIALFAKANWSIAPTNSGLVPIKLWADWVLDVRLPILILCAILIGVLPVWAVGRVKQWRLRKRLDIAEATIAAFQANTSASVAAPVAQASEPALKDDAETRS